VTSSRLSRSFITPFKGSVGSKLLVLTRHNVVESAESVESIIGPDLILILSIVTKHLADDYGVPCGVSALS
jgi:hypothetical protein